jgi:NADPH-dependent 2,4-dienoyl-CoA reductase/sulfur reductase-like enzyme
VVERLVVVGGDAAGMSAATNARRLRSPDELEIVAFERSSYASFSACGEPYYVAGYLDSIEELLVRSPEWFAESGIELRLRHEVTAIDTAGRTVTVRDLDAGRDDVVEYNTLMYATGAAPRPLEIEGADLEGVHYMRTLADAELVRALIESGARRPAIVGGGLIGIEMAEAFLEAGLPVALISSGAGLLKRLLDPEMSELLAERARALGVEVVAGTRADRLLGRDGHVVAVGAGDHVVEADLVLLGVGVEPNVALAEAAGIPLGESGAVWVDERQRTKVAGVYAGGDCAESMHRITGAPVNYALGTTATKHGRVAGLNIGGGDATFPGVLGTTITKLRDVETARTGASQAEAAAASLDVVAATFGSTTVSGYMPEAERMTVRVIAERGSRRLVGAQIVGGKGAAKRIDSLAMAVWTGITIDELINVDLSYSPPFSGVWEAANVAARKLQPLLS